MVNQSWDEAGFTDTQSRLGKPVPSGHVLVPRSVEIDGAALSWKFEPGHEWKTYRPSGQLLNRFVRLWRLGPEDILRFAREYGVILFDDHANLAFHWNVEGKELITAWYEISRKACAFLSVASTLNRGRLGDPEDWRMIDPSVDPTFPKHADSDVARYLPHGVAAARQRFQRTFGDWLHLARISFGLTLNTEKKFAWRTEIDYGGRLFSALVLQLLLTFVNADSLYFCSGCGLPYARPRGRGWKKPRPGQGNFCLDCGRDEALRQADERRREKIAETKRLHLAGRSPTEIAKELDTKPASVRRWLRKGKRHAQAKTQ